METTEKRKDGPFSIVRDLAENRVLLFKLSKDDFRKRFSGSYLGIFWAFVQPIIQILIYWFVFEKALNAGTQSTKAGITVPFVLWLIAGMVPWFYFSEVWSAGTSVFLEYSFLVKKVVFKISILPFVKLISGLFVHVFFLLFMLILFSCYGMFPGVWFLQVFYYSFCMMVLAVGLTYISSAIIIFFRDLGQIIAILLQVLVWVTPIMWNIDAMTSLPGWAMVILKLNPMYYVVNGYRDSMISHIGFWEHGPQTIYFWVLAVLLLCLGDFVFLRLKPHFADAL